MERFTNGTIGLKNISNCGKAIDRLTAYEDTGLTPEEVTELAKAKRRAEKALGYIKKIFGCDECVHDNDDTNYETCKSCNIYDKWRWRRDVEEGDAE